MTIRRVEVAEVFRKRVLLRADFDVPLLRSRKTGAGGPSGVFSSAVADDFRLQRMIPTFELLLRNQAKIIAIGDLGRPGGKIVEEDRLAPVFDWFSQRYPQKVKYVRAITGLEVRQTVLTLTEGEILLLENLRFDPGEEANREAFAKELASYGQLYVNECFATSHRNHASLATLPKFLPSFAGINLTNEVENLSQVLTHARRPLVLIIGGAKLETKIPVIDSFLKIAEKVLVTGKIGVEIAKLPHYHTNKLIYSIGEPDILPDELERFSSLISIAGTIVWNGPAGDVSHGYFEGTKKLGEIISQSNAKTIVGGGDTNGVLHKFGLRDRFSFVSTGGGAMLEFLAGKNLPGIAPLLLAES